MGQVTTRKPKLRAVRGGSADRGASMRNSAAIYRLHCDGNCRSCLFCDNETNVAPAFRHDDADGYFKDAFHEYLVDGNHDGGESRRRPAPRRRALSS